MQNSKIVILTLPIGGNYGGIMQAYALQTYLRDLGFDASTTYIREYGLLERAARLGYYTAKRIINQFRPSASTLTPDLNVHRNANTLRFVERYIRQIDGKKLYRSEAKADVDAIVVGSDQVWRRIYASIPTYMLDFTEGWDIKRLSYSASFGRDDLNEYKDALIEKSAQLAKAFDAISVREDTAVELVRKHWAVDAEHHVDPTLLLDLQHYQKLIEENRTEIVASNGNLFAYVLDHHEPKGGIINRAANQLGLKPFNVLPPPVNSRKEFFANLPKYQLPPVPQWLQSFADAEFVITDSFHGTAFAILFHKPFLAIGNARRGMARFQSLLRLFGLEDRLVAAIDDVTDDLLSAPIDWEKVDSVIQSERLRSREFLLQNLSDEEI